MNLYYGGYGKYKFYTVAENEAEAINNIGVNYNMMAFPVTVEVINNIDGYTITAVKEVKEVKEVTKKAGAK